MPESEDVELLPRLTAGYETSKLARETERFYLGVAQLFELWLGTVQLLQAGNLNAEIDAVTSKIDRR